MCGIVGKIYLGFEQPVNSELIQRMMDIIAHRGPDGEGKFISGPIGLGHRRLSIIDLNTGDQPMCNEDETIWIVFNGEIYNFIELRKNLIKQGHKFRSTSDTEVIIHLYEEKGAECVQDLQGMFTFAIWDSRTSILFIARDRVGIKPLYYADTGRAIVFGSELKSLLVDPDVSRDLNPQAIETFLTFNYVPGSETLFRNINKLEPGHYILVQRKKVTKKQYWDLLFQPSMEFNSLEQAAVALSELLRQTVNDHMIRRKRIRRFKPLQLDSLTMILRMSGLMHVWLQIVSDRLIMKSPFRQMNLESFYRTTPGTWKNLYVSPRQ
jgi:asparagine synthase (glutamine-hydrolysing)